MLLPEHTIKIYSHRTYAMTENTIENVKSPSFLNCTAIKKTENEQEKKVRHPPPDSFHLP